VPKYLNIHYAVGCAMFVPCYCLSKLKEFNEDIFYWNDDAEFSIRALQAGYNVIVSKEAIVYHKMFVTRKKTQVGLQRFLRYEKSRFILLMTMNFTSRFWLLKAIFTYILSASLLILYRSFYDKSNLSIAIKAFLKNIMNIFSIKSFRFNFRNTFFLFYQFKKSNNLKNISFLSLKFLFKSILNNFRVVVDDKLLR